MGRPWTETDLQYLEKNYRKVHTSQLAQKLNRTVRSVYNTAKQYGIATEKMVVSDNAIKAVLRKNHRHGLTDTEIAAQLLIETGTRVDRHRISNLRRAMGLPSNKTSQRQRDRVRNQTRQQLAKAKLPTLASVRVQRFNQWKRDLGWPDHLTVRAVQALEMFYQHGPLTRVQLCVLLGVSSKSRTAPKSRAKGGTVMAELMAAGLVSKVPKAITVPYDLKLHDDPHGSRPRKTSRVIRHKNISLYILNPGVEPDGNRKTTTAERAAASGPRPTDNVHHQGRNELAGPDAIGRSQLDQRRRRQGDHRQASRKGQAGK